MITTDEAIKFIIIAVVIGLLLTFQTVINLRKQFRSRQAAWPVIAMLYCAIFLFFIMRNHGRLSSILSAHTLPLFRDNFILAANLALLAGFCIIKAVSCPLINRIWQSRRLMEITASFFYIFEERFGLWFLKRGWVNFRQLCKAFVFSVAAISVGYLYASCVYLENKNWPIYFPCALLMIVGEIWHFMAGLTKEEFQHSVIGDDTDTRRLGQYYRIREIYELIFAPQVLTAHTGCEFSRRYGATEMIKNFAASNGRIDKIIADYFTLLDKSIFPDPDYAHATSRLMHGNSVIFFNPFYRDLTIYVTLPIINALLAGKKCLVIAGRSCACEDVKAWMAALLKNYSGMESLWRVAELSGEKAECEVGLLSLMQLYDLNVLQQNTQFFHDVDFVLLIEPSVVLSTGQVGLNMITDELRKRENKPVYCVCDRKTEGLVDTLSHLLYTEIIEVVATPVPRCMYAGMTWNADGDYIRQQLFDKQTKFLGNGIELAAVAVKNQIPKVTWYGGTKSPVLDIKWIAGQYHPTLCRYMNLSAQQHNLYEKIEFVPNLWSAPTVKEQFVIAEDEFSNMFSLMRSFLSRGTDQIFINILSENYLLRDYMRYNRQMFISDPNAVPSVVPDYAKTERNTLFKLLLYMAYRPVSEKEIINELSFAGLTADDALGSLSCLLHKYTNVDESIFTLHSALTVKASCSYCILSGTFDRHFADSLKNAYFLVDEEEHNTAFIDGKLFGHVTQQLLPGQFITYDGKYYQAKIVSASEGVILRRASDLYSGRKYYRQIRSYVFEQKDVTEIVSVKKVSDVETAFVRLNFRVVTTGYLEMNDNNDLRAARVIDFTSDPSIEKYERAYKNKTAMRLLLPETDENTRFTLCMLLSEMFRSVLPNSWHYIGVTAKRPKDIGGMLNYLVYQLNMEDDDEYIYILEDSDMDLGLLEAIERNLISFMEIVTDVLDWHFEKMREPEHIDPDFAAPFKREEEQRRGRFIKMADRIRKLFGVKKEEVNLFPLSESKVSPMKAPESEAEKPVIKEEEYSLERTGETTDNPAKNFLPDMEADPAPPTPEPIDVPTFISVAADAYQEEIMAPDAEADYLHIDGTDIFDEEGVSADSEWIEEGFKAVGIVPVGKTRYQSECFLKFGFDEIDKRIKLEDVRNYLRARGYSNSPITKARKRDIAAKQTFDFESGISCDFCGQPLTGVSYERITDGRLRCNQCSSSAIASVDEFKELFYRVMGIMEGMYTISFKVPISVKMTDARAIAKSIGIVFRPGTEAMNRVLGYAQKKNGNYNIFFENGSPYLAAIDLIVHEMTHIWQFVNWDDANIKKIYKESASNVIYEGMAMWSSIQYLYQIGETYYAQLQEALTEIRTDAYGEGFKLFRERYPFIKDSALLKSSPFLVYPPL